MIIYELEKLYFKQGIHATKFECKFRNECSKNHEKFTEAKSASVPSKYETSIPRIAFLSLDSGSGDKEIKERTPEGVRAENESHIVAQLKKGQHWYETHFWATKIINSIGEMNIDITDSKYYFAHLNSAKCCQNKPNHRQADNILFQNCNQYLKEELKIIIPQILISQGVKATESLMSICTLEEKFKSGISLIKVDNIKMLHFSTYHPSAYGYYYKQKKSINEILDELKFQFKIKMW